MSGLMRSSSNSDSTLVLSDITISIAPGTWAALYSPELNTFLYSFVSLNVETCMNAVFAPQGPLAP